MNRSSPEVVALGTTAQNLLRIIIASYFIALSLGLVSGATLQPLAATLLPDQLATVVSSLILFALASLVVLGVYIRPAALGLGVITLAGSLASISAIGIPEALGTFWGDMVLVAALMLTYSGTAPHDRQSRRVVRHKRALRRITPTPAASYRLNKTSILDEPDGLDENIFTENGVYA